MLAEILEKSGLEVATRESIEKGLKPFFDEFDIYSKIAKALIVDDEGQKDLMAEAKEMRLKFVKIRTASGKVKDLLKKDSRNYEKTVMSAYNLIKSEVEAVERHLLAQEKFAEIKENERIAELGRVRREEARDLSAWIPDGVTFGKMTEEEFNRVLTSAKLMKKYEEEEEKKRIEQEKLSREAAEKERIGNEAIRAENARIKAENEKLKQAKEVEDNLLGETKKIIIRDGSDFKPTETAQLLQCAEYLRHLSNHDFPKELKDEKLNKVLHNAKLLIEKTAKYIEENS